MAGRKGRGHHRHQHGGRGTDILLGGNADFLFKRVLYQDDTLTEERKQQILEQIKTECERTNEVVASRVCTSSARSATKAAGSTTSSAAAPDVKATQALAFLPVPRRRFDAHLCLRARLADDAEARDGGRHTDRTWHGHTCHCQRSEKVEAHNFEVRKQLLEYDDVMNKQREVIYQHRHAVLASEHIQQDIHDMMKDLVNALVDTYCPVDQYQEEWDFNGLGEALRGQFALDITQGKGSVADHFKDVGRDALIDEIKPRFAAPTTRKSRNSALNSCGTWKRCCSCK